MGKFLLVVLLFAAAVYGLFWLLERRRSGALRRPRPTKPRPRTVAPDDDEDFLRELGRANPEDTNGSGPTDAPTS